MSEIIATSDSKLQHFPITLMPSAMGLIGLSVVFMKFQHIFQVDFPIGQGLLYLVSAYFILVMTTYGIRTLRYPSDVARDFNHPIRVNFFPAISICFLLFSISYTDAGHLQIAKILWLIGTPLHLFLLLVILHGWFHNNYDLKMFNPAWFIPVVGPLLVPVVGVEFFNSEISWFFFSIGILYWIMLMAVLLNRIFFNMPMAPKLLPTLFILIAPPAVGFISYLKLTNTLDPAARILFYFGVFTTLMLLSMIGKFRKVPFFLSWWAYTFPLAAFTLSNVMMYKATKLPFYKGAVFVLTIITTLVVLLVLIRTIMEVTKGKICVPED
ncbi:MAG: C4-dicarboxylate ABC transporter [bacterium]|nr:C4-dicarboxylate ABC transporter [bacterium]